VSDAREVVKTGDIVKVQVVEVDVARKRIALSMKIGAAPARQSGDNRFQQAGRGERQQRGDDASLAANSAMASAFAKLKR
jgi:uncharacterized protein